MPNESLWGVNETPPATLKRLRFIHIVWLGLVLAAGWMSVMRGVQAGQLLTILFVAGLPGLLGMIFLSGDSVDPQARQFTDRLIVLAWTLLAALGLAVTGGAGSALTILFAIGPMVAFGLGRRGLAGEAAVFAVLAYFGAALMDAGGISFSDLALGRMIGPGFAFAGLILTALLVWTLFQSVEGAMGRIRAAATAEGRAEMSAPKIEPSKASNGAALIALPDRAGVLLLDVTPEGRIRSYSGDVLGMKLLKPGKALAAVFAGGWDVTALTSAAGWSGEAELAHGRRVALSAAPSAQGTQILMRDLSEREDAGHALEAARDQLKARTAFFASLGHDLKTPLNAILGYSDMMRAEIRGPLPEPYADYPGIIHESGQDLLLLVEDILDLAKAEADSHRLEIEPVDLSASGQSVMRQLANQAERAEVTLSLTGEEEVWAEADARAIRQIWQNLVSNAIKYSERGGEVVLDARNTAEHAVLTVTDTGAGMSEDDLARATEPFQQGSNAAGRAGTGLGLAVVKRFAELHDGSLEIQTKLGEGARVEVSLPKADMSDVQPLDEAAQ
jgi:cell cycle sensor histidine kinase DivJ